LAYVNSADAMTLYSQEVVIDTLEHKDVGTYSCSYFIGNTQSPGTKVIKLLEA
jgi:hypothetical protein